MIIVMVVLLAACSNKTNTAKSRWWQAFNTRYNVYYHGKTNYDEQLKEMMDKYEDDYSQHLFVHPAEAYNNPKSPQPTGSFDRTIEKMQKAITLHSIKAKPKRKGGKLSTKDREWLKRDEYNPFIHNAWYMLAKSEYMKGDFLNAAATFRYITRHFQWKKQLVEETQIWEALCYCAMDWTTEADNVLSHIHIDKIENKHNRALANLAFADYYIKTHQNEQAIPYLAQAVNGFKGGQKVRLNFLLGQLYEEAGDKRNAYLAYKRAGSSSGSTYRTKFNARIKQSAVYEGANIASEVSALKRMTHYDRNKDYLDQIYYAIGNLYLSHADTARAIDNYKLAAEKSTRNGVDKAISQLTLGGIYFNQRKYDLSQPCYAEALPLINENYPNYKDLKRRSDVLDELAVYSQNVTLQDSLLKLSRMTPEEQKKVIEKIIEELKKKEKEEAEEAARAEYMAQQNAKGNQLGQNANAPSTYTLNTDNSWYFYNTTTKNAGKTAFQQLWGSRKLEDDWRRRNKQTFSLEDEESDTTMMAMRDSVMVTAEGDTVKIDQEALKRSEDPHYEEYYLKQIPKTEEEIQASNDIIQEGLYNMGIILKDKLEDYDAAAYEFNELLDRYPDNTYRLDVYYNMYLMYMRNGQETEANHYRDSILTDFAESKYGQAMQDPNYLDNLRNMQVEQERIYEQAYANYLANNNEAVHQAYATMMRKYPLSKIMPKFMFIDALSYLTQKDYDKFKETLKEMLKRYPETDITPTASSIVQQINSGRRLEGGGSNVRGMLWTTRLSNDTTPQDLERKFTPFSEDNDKPQVFILLYPTDSVNANMLLYEVARHNFNTFVVKDYDLEQMNFNRLGLLVVKGFADFKEAVHYRSVFEQDQSLSIPRQVHYVIISVDNFNLLLNEGRSFEDYFNYLEEKNDTEHSNLEKAQIEAEKHDIESESQIDEDSDEGTELEKAQRAADAENERWTQETEQAKQPNKSVKNNQRSTNEDVEKSLREAERQEVERLEAERQEAERLEAERQEAERLETERQEAERLEAEKQSPRRDIKPSDYRQGNGNSQATVTPTAEKTKEQEKEEERYLKELEKQAKQREKAEAKRQKAINDSIKKVEKQQAKAERIRELEIQDSIENAQREAEQLRINNYKSKEDSIRAVYKANAEAKKQAKKEKEEARKQKAKERKELAKQREKERKEKAKQREKERKEKVKARKEAQKQREKERKEAQKQKQEAKKQKQKDKQEATKSARSAKNNTKQAKKEAQSQSAKPPTDGTITSNTSDDDNDKDDGGENSVTTNKKDN